MNAIEIKGLCKSYPGFSLENINLTLPSGCIMGLVGENGAGKSTTIKLLLDMIKRDGGTITLLGKDNQKDQISIREDIGVVLDEVGFPECLSATQIHKIMKHTYKSWDGEVYVSLLEKLSIPEKKEFKDLSRGMKMKLALAVALSHHPKLLILDEATNGLDPIVRDQMMDLFMEFARKEEHSILFSSHIVSDLEKICDYIAFLHRGKLLLCEEKDRLLEEYGICMCRPEEVSKLPHEAVVGEWKNPYGVKALVRRKLLPAGMEAGRVNIEELFIGMVKEEAS